MFETAKNYITSKLDKLLVNYNLYFDGEGFIITEHIPDKEFKEINEYLSENYFGTYCFGVYEVYDLDSNDTLIYSKDNKSNLKENVFEHSETFSNGGNIKDRVMIQKQIDKIKRQLEGSLIPEQIKPALRKKLEQLKSELSSEKQIVKVGDKGMYQGEEVKILAIDDLGLLKYKEINSKEIKLMNIDIFSKSFSAFPIKNIKTQQSDYEKEKERQKEQGLIDDDTEGISVLGMTQGKNAPAKVEPKTVTSFEYKMKVDEPKNQKPDITAKYENQYYLNKAIEQLIYYNIENNNANFSIDEINFIERYTGYGGLQNITKDLGVREKGIMTEYYTPDKLIQTMWGLAYKHGFTDGGAILENSVGIGKFLKYAPKSSNIDAYEINRYSYLICKILYPFIDIRNIPYENNFIENHSSVKGNVTEKYDLVIGNPPYGNFDSKYSDTEKKYTKANNLIEYFITRSLDELKQGGLLIYVIGTSIEAGGKPFLDSKPNECKNKIMQKGEIIDAYRLGNKVFTDTGVLADIIILRKK